MDDPIETTRLLAKFKLQVRRQLDQSVDLQLLTHDAGYARQRLAEIEDAAEDEALLVTLLQLRARLLPQPAPGAATTETQPAEADDGSATRQYKFGARSW